MLDAQQHFATRKRQLKLLEHNRIASGSRSCGQQHWEVKQQQRQHKKETIGSNTTSASTDAYATMMVAFEMKGSAPSSCLQGQYKKSNMESGLLVVVVASVVVAKDSFLFPNGISSKGDSCRLLNAASAAAVDDRDRVATTLPQRTRPRGLPLSDS